MKEKGKLILIYVLMFLVIVLIVALTFVVLNNTSKEKNQSFKANNTPTVDVNPYPEISDECTFNLTLNEYNALTGPKCKGGYSRYNVTGLTINEKTINLVIIYSDENGTKEGLYVNDSRKANITDVANIKLGIFDNKLFILNKNNNESNVLVYANDSTKLYDLKETLDSKKILDPILSVNITSKTIDPNSFNFTDNNFTFKTKLVNDANQDVYGSTYQVNFTKNNFSDPVAITN